MTDAHRSGDRGGSSEPVRLASFGRRLAAFILDMLLLGVIGEVFQAAFSDPLGQIGEYRRLVEWTCAIVYFGCFESRVWLRALRFEHVVGTGIFPPPGFSKRT